MTDSLGSLSWQSLVSSLRDEAIVVGLDYRISYANQPTLKRLGIPRDQVIGKSCYEVLHDGADSCGEAEGECPVRRAITTGETATMIHRRLRQGYRYYVQIRASPLKDTDDQTVGVLCVSRELGLAERYQRIFHSMDDGVLVVSRSGRMVEANPALCDMLGYTREELADKNAVDFISVDLASTLRDQSDEKSRLLEVNLPRKDGTLLPVELSVSPLPLGPVTLYVAFVRDISHRKEWERTEAQQAQALAVSEAQYRAIFDNASDILLVVEDDTTIAIVNRQFEDMTGYSAEEVEGKMTFLPLLTDEERDSVVAMHRMRRERPVAFRSQHRHWVVTKDDQKWLAEVNASIIPGTRRSLVSMRDVTEDYRLQEQILRRNRETEVLYAVAALVSRSSDITATLEGVLEKALDHVGLSRGYVFLLDEEQQKLLIKASRGSSLSSNAESPDGLDLSEGFAGWVARTGEPLFVRYASDDPLLPDPTLVAGGLQTLACVPISSGGKVIGVMGLSGSEIRDYSREEQRLLTSIGNEIGAAVERDRLLQKAQQRAQELESLMSMTREMASTLDLNEVLDRTLAIMCHQIGATNGFISLIDEDKGRLTTKAYWGKDAATSRKAWKSKVGEGVVGWVAQHHQGIVCDDVFADPRIHKSPGADVGYHSIVAVPLKVKEKLLGVVAAVSKEKAAFTGADLRLLSAYAAEASMALENALLHEEMRRQASTDDLTRLTNRRYFYMRLDDELKRARRYGHSVSLLFLDVDDLKQINDRYGHLQGDELLRHVASLLMAIPRSTDIAARYGGDEFVVLLPETGRDEAVSLAERILKEATPCPLLSGGSIQWQMSIGVAWVPVDGSYEVDVLRLADEAVYRAKQNGTGWDYARPDVNQAPLPLDSG